MLAPTLALCVLLAAEPVTPEVSIHDRAWKVTLIGTLTGLVGVGFLVAGTLVLDTNPGGATLNTGHAFQIGGVMLASVGLLLVGLSIPMWVWRSEGPAPALSVALGPGNLRVTW